MSPVGSTLSPRRANAWRLLRTADGVTHDLPGKAGF